LAGFYEVTVTLGGSLSHRLFAKNYTQPGEYTEVIPAPNHRIGATVVVRLRNRHGQVHADSYVLSFNVHFYKMLKWLLVGPFTAMAAVLLTMGTLGRADSALPAGL
jgi:hypothetical protein